MMDKKQDKTILIADDDAGIIMVLEHCLSDAGYHVMATDNAETLLSWAIAGQGDLVITDVNMPGRSGLDILPEMKQARPHLPVIVISAQKTFHTAMQAENEGAIEYLPKPFDLNVLKQYVQNALAQISVEKTTQAPILQQKSAMVGQSKAMQELYKMIARLKQSDLTILVKGETGTGKEIVAKALHDHSKWAKGPFVAVNMAAIPHDLIEAELFGHEKGAFTGAHQKRIGRFEEAAGGTLFLDEIGDMPFSAQTRLLRVLQEGEFQPIGSNKTIKTDVRIVAATHQDLQQQVAAGKFRQDLYYRLNIVPLYIPPLRERIEDIPLFVAYFAQKAGVEKTSFAPEAIAALQKQAWHGNVRELENMIYRILALNPHAKEISAGMVLDGADIQAAPVTETEVVGTEKVSESISEMIQRQLEQYFTAYEGVLPPDGLYDRVIEQVERPMIIRCLKATNGNQIQAAKLLGLNRNTLRKKIKMLQIPIIKE